MAGLFNYASDEQWRSVQQAALSANRLQDEEHPLNQPGTGIGPEGEGLLGGRVYVSLQASPESIRGHIEVVHPNACGTSVFTIHSIECARVFEHERCLHDQKQFLAILYEHPMPSSFWQEGDYPKINKWNGFDPQGHDLVIISNLVTFLSPELENWPEWTHRLHQRAVDFISATDLDSLNFWRYHRYKQAGQFYREWASQENLQVLDEAHLAISQISASRPVLA